MCGPRAVPALLLHTSLFLALYGGAGLATAARLKWDPITYIALRELFPREYRVAVGTLTIASAALVVLGHIAALAAASYQPRRILLLLYVVGMTTLVVMEIALVCWLASQAVKFLNSEQAKELAEALEVRDHLRPLLHYLGKWHPLPTKLRALIDEAEADLPRNGYVAGFASVLLLVLQVSSIVLALFAIRSRARIWLSETVHANGISRTHETARKPNAPAHHEVTKLLKSAHKDGRLIIA